MYRSKRDVDRYVSEIDRTIKNEVERSLKSITVAKLYYNIGEYQTALVHLEQYETCRKNSAPALRLRGQVFDGLAQSAEPGEKSRLNGLALQSYRRSIELDLSQTDLLLKIGELMLNLPIEEQGKARYWLEEAEKIYPHNKTLKKLRDKIQRAKDGLEDILDETAEEDVNGNGAANDSDDNVAFCTPRGGSASLLANSQTRRFQPRPSPERIASQVRTVEINQEKLLNAVQENGKSQLETLESVLAEMRLTRDEFKLGRDENSKLSRDMIEIQASILNELRNVKDDTSRQLRENTRCLKDATSELTNLCDDMTRQMKALVTATKASRDEIDEERSTSRTAAAKSQHENIDINDILLQQYSRLPPAHLFALMQMSGMHKDRHLTKLALETESASLLGARKKGAQTDRCY